MPGEDIFSWSTTAIDNGNADTAINWVEGQPRASVNNSARSVMAAHAKNRDLITGAIVTTGTPNAQIAVSQVGYTTLPTHLCIKLQIGPALTNDGPATLKLDSTADIAIKTSFEADLTGDELVAGTFVDLLFDGTTWIFLGASDFFARRDSAVLTGDPQAPTAPLGDHDNSIANTFWVRREMSQGPGIILAHHVFSTPGTSTWTPDPLMKCCMIECVGGGGGGGDAAASAGNSLNGGGGGSGGYSRKLVFPVDVGVSQVVTVGVGGAGAPGGTQGLTGGDSSVGGLCIAHGGRGGGSSLDGDRTPVGGFGGAPGLGDLTAAGSPGEQGGYVLSFSSNVQANSGNGGSSVFGGGGKIPSVGTAGSAAGTPAGPYGSGGSGAISHGTGGYLGAGAGSSGVIIITEFAGTGGAGANGVDGATGPQGPAGPPGPPGPAGAGTGNVLVSGTPSAGQFAQWVDSSHIAGVNSPSGFTTGDAKLTLKTTADTGFVMMDDGTIGDASSSATTRANADCQSLFTLLWTNIPDAWCPVPGGRGGTAGADWIAHKRITLPRQLGRALAIGGAGASLTSRALGSYVGEETHTQTVGELPSHAHSFIANLASYSGASNVDPGSTFGVDNASASAPAGTLTTGSGTPFNVMQPTAFWNVMIKL